MRVVRVLCVLGMMVALLSLAACGGSSSGSHDDADNLSSVTRGIAVDPYIVGATFFEDRNGNGIRDTGEQLSSPTDDNGLFIFDEPVAIGSTLVMQDTGEHQGLPFTLIFKREIAADDVEPAVVSPLTTIMAAGITEEELLALLDTAGIPWIDDIQTEDFYLDPMAGLSELRAGDAVDADVALLRTNFVAYAVMEFINRFAGNGLTYDSLEDVLETEGFVQLLFDTMELICSAAMLEEVESEIPAEGYPAMSMADLAETIPAVFYYWTGQFYSDMVADKEYFPAIGEIEDELKDIVLRLAPYTYALNHRDDPAVDPEELDLPSLDSDYYMVIVGDRVSEVRPIEQEIALDAEYFENVAFAMADEILHFYADGSWETFSMDDDLVEQSGGNWSVDGNQLLITDTAEDEEVTLTFIGEWPTYLRFMTTDPVMDGQPPGVVNLPLAKVRNIDTKDFEGQIFIVEDEGCSFDSDFCGGRVEFGSWDAGAGEGDATLHIYDEGSTTPVPATWSIAGNNALIVETADEISELYFLPSGSENERDVLIVTKDSDGTVIDVVEESLYPVVDRPDAGAFTIESDIHDDEEFNLCATGAFSGQFYDESTNQLEEESGQWTYDSSTGDLELSVEGEVAVRLWYYSTNDAQEGHYQFYYTDYESGLPVESGFDVMILDPDATPVCPVQANAYIWHQQEKSFMSIDLDEGSMTPINNHPSLLEDPSGFDFINGQIYSIWAFSGGTIYIFDESTGDYSYAANITGLDGDNYIPTGIAYDESDDVCYISVASQFGTTSYLYQLNLTTYEADQIGMINAGMIIGIASDGNGSLYGIDLVDDSLYSIDVTSGNGTKVGTGTLGFDIQWSQDIAFDRSSGTLYGGLYGTTAPAGGLYSISIQDGTATLIGDPTDVEITGFAISD